jgi:hypothetical protein
MEDTTCIAKAICCVLAYFAFTVHFCIPGENANIEEDKTDTLQVPEGNTVEENPDGAIISSRLFVRNLPFSCTEEDLRMCFSNFGQLVEDEGVHIPLGTAC